jgi:VIT1/CCC1 family predicted Fe2+/Mn2+ transporter
VIAGLAELFSGAISMGLGAYLAAVTERDHYLSEEKREREEVERTPEEEKEEIYEIMHAYGVKREATKPLVDALASDSEQWVRVRRTLCLSGHFKGTDGNAVHDAFRAQA